MDIVIQLFIVVGILSAVILALFFMLWRKANQNRKFRERFEPILDVEAERDRIAVEARKQQQASMDQVARTLRHNQEMQNESDRLSREIAALRAEFQTLDEESNLRSFGYYEPRYAFSDVERYKLELDRIKAQQKEMLKEKKAAVCSSEWTVNGSRAEGQKQINQTIKLMIRAFNGECDAAIAKVRYNNIHVMEARINKAYEAINGLASVQQAFITGNYRDLKLRELRLAYEYAEKVQAEREEQRQIREQMREEEIAQRELERAKEEAAREENRYQTALEKARIEMEQASGAKHDRLEREIERLQALLAEAQERKERAIAQAQLTRSGYVYVISNIGAFGEQVFKIGMTRRLDPMDRVRELGDASVPFPFDVHAMIYSDDAPSLETKLHRFFETQRVNRINYRKEFFRVKIEDVAKIVQDEDAKIDFTLLAEAEEYRKSLAIVEAEKHKTISSLQATNDETLVARASLDC